MVGRLKQQIRASSPAGRCSPRNSAAQRGVTALSGGPAPGEGTTHCSGGSRGPGRVECPCPPSFAQCLRANESDQQVGSALMGLRVVVCSIDVPQTLHHRLRVKCLNVSDLTVGSSSYRLSPRCEQVSGCTARRSPGTLPGGL